MKYVRVNRKGEVEFPREILARAGIEPGDEVIIREKKKEFSLKSGE